MLWLTACLINEELYRERMAALADLDGDGVVAEDDCDDLDDAVFPGAAEACNGNDDDCDGDTDEDFAALAETCNGIDDDCDGDTDEDFAALAETCNGIDDDCDGDTDEEAVDATTWHLDADGDGYGSPEVIITACDAQTRYVADASDCDDNDGDAHPGGTEVPYDGADQDCDGADLVDVDLDGHDAAEVGGDDCDDADPLTYPGADESWERGFTDSDCDGGLEELQGEYGDVAWLGDSAGGQLGYRLGTYGDLDGDGDVEAMASALFDNEPYEWGGSVAVLDGAPTGEVSSLAQIFPGGERWFLGVSMHGGVDVDADGVPDAILGADGYDGGEGSAWVVPGASLVSGGDIDLPFDAIGVVYGTAAGSYAGHSVRALGDFAGTGEAWAAVAVPYATVDGMLEAGRIALFAESELGSVTVDDASGTVDGYYELGQFGLEVEDADDQDGDGIADYLARFATGDIAVILPGGLLDASPADDRIAMITGTGSGETASCSVIGDVDEDGDRDVGCAASSSALIFTSLGGGETRTIDDYSVAISLGPDGYTNEVVGLGDLDGDTVPETAVASPYDAFWDASTLAVIRGSSMYFGGVVEYDDDRLFALSAITDASFGHRVLAPGDVTGDGHDDILLAGPNDDRGGTDAGAVAVVTLPH